MRCVCCDRNLSNIESVLRHPVTNEFLDICRKCLPDTGIIPVEPGNIDVDETYEEDEFFVEEDEDDHFV